jgi:ligand-binding sensor domain-containing protein/signal transduction histidine kinase
MTTSGRSNILRASWVVLFATGSGLFLFSHRVCAEARPAAGEYLIDVWRTEHGLPHNTVTAITQTRDGFLWVGTQRGLARFDGVRFTMLKFAETDDSNWRISCLLEDTQRNLWVGTDRGLFRYAQGRFASFSASSGLSDDPILSLCEDTLKNVWIGTQLGLHLWNGDRFEPFTEEAGFPAAPKPVLAMERNRAGSLWIATGQSICRLTNRKFTTFLHETVLDRGRLTRAREDRSGTLWMGRMEAGLLRCSSTGRLMAYSEADGLAAGDVQAIEETRDGDLWVGTERGLTQVRNGALSTWTIKQGLSQNSIRALFEDHEGNLWIGTDGGGLNRLKRNPLRIFGAQQGFQGGAVMSLAEGSAGAIWAGLNGGGLRYGPADSEGRFSESGILPANAVVWPLLAARDGGLWIGTFGDGLFRWSDGLSRWNDDVLGNQPLSQSGGLAPDSPAMNHILALCEDRKGNLWVGTYHGLFKRTSEGLFMPFQIPVSASDPAISCIIEDRQDDLWLGRSSGGLLRWHEGKFTRYDRKDGLASDLIRTLYEDNEGTLWIGTGGGGLSRLKQGRFCNLASREGLPDDVISQLLEDDFGHLWIGSNRGICRVRKSEIDEFAAGRLAQITAVSYGRSEGMLSLECTGGFHPAGLKTKDGRLWFSTVQGVVMVDPRKLTLNPRPPPMVIEALRIDGQMSPISNPADRPGPSVAAAQRLSSAGSGAGIIKVAHGTETLEFLYTALSFVAPEKVRFKYRLHGFDRDWVDAGVQRSARYTRLPTGDYRFQVIACNNDGIWSETGASLAFAVPAPFWQTAWFLAGSGLALVGSIAALVRYISLRSMQSRLAWLEQQHAVEKERTRIAQDMHDEIGAKLTKISFLSGLAKRDIIDPKKAAVEVDRISQTTREVLRGLDEIVWAVSPKNDTLDNLATYICQHAGEFFQDTGIHCRLEMPHSFPAYPLSTEVRHNLFLAVKEALTNILKHAQATEARIHMGIDSTMCEITVSDNGRGFSPSGLAQEAALLSPAAATVRNGNGLANIRQRVGEAGGEFRLESEPGHGAKLVFTIHLQSKGSPVAKPYSSFTRPVNGSQSYP